MNINNLMLNIQEDLINFIDFDILIEEINFENDLYINEIIYKILITLSDISKHHNTINHDKLIDRIILYIDDARYFITKIMKSSQSTVNRIMNNLKKLFDGYISSIDRLKNLKEYKNIIVESFIILGINVIILMII